MGWVNFRNEEGGQALSMTRGAASKAKSQAKRWIQVFSTSKGATSGLENPAMARLCLLKGKILAAAVPTTFSSALRKLDSPEHVVARVTS